MANNILPQREEFLKKKRKRKIIKYSIIFGVIVFIISIASFISHRASIRISEVELVGGVLVTQEEVGKFALEYMNGSYAFLFPENNSFWYPRKALATFLKEKFKRIDSINLNLKNFRVLRVKITEREPLAIWCLGLPTISSDRSPLNNKTQASSSESRIISIEKQCYFIDDNGTIFAIAPEFSGDAYFKYFGLITEENPIGSQYMASSTKFVEITQFVDSLRKLNLHPLFMYAKENHEFTVIMNGGSEIFFDTKKPLAQVLENLETLLSTSPFTKGLSNVSYIDLRYGNKLFYKLRTE